MHHLLFTLVSVGKTGPPSDRGDMNWLTVLSTVLASSSNFFHPLKAPLSPLMANQCMAPCPLSPNIWFSLFQWLPPFLIPCVIFWSSSSSWDSFPEILLDSYLLYWSFSNLPPSLRVVSLFIRIIASLSLPLFQTPFLFSFESLTWKNFHFFSVYRTLQEF